MQRGVRSGRGARACASAQGQSQTDWRKTDNGTGGAGVQDAERPAQLQESRTARGTHLAVVHHPVLGWTTLSGLQSQRRSADLDELTPNLFLFSLCFLVFVFLRESPLNSLCPTNQGRCKARGVCGANVRRTPRERRGRVGRACRPRHLPQRRGHAGAAAAQGRCQDDDKDGRRRLL